MTINKSIPSIIIENATNSGFKFPGKNTKLIYLYIRQWLEEQDVFINIVKYESMPLMKYLYEIKIGYKKYTPTGVYGCESAEKAVEAALIYIFNTEAFNKKK